MTLRFKLPTGGDVPPVTAARRVGLSLDAFREALPKLVARGFPPADATTGNFDIDAIDAWSKSDAMSPLGRLRAMGLNPAPDALGIGFVYFIRGCGLIKIGRAMDPLRRLKGLQLGSPATLSLACAVPGGGDLEKTLHHFFGVERRHGEWFEASDRLETYVARCRKMGFAPDMGFLVSGAPDLRGGCHDSP